MASSNLIDLRCIESGSVWQLLYGDWGYSHFLQVLMTIWGVNKLTLLFIYQIGLHRVNVVQLSACIYSIGIRLIRLEEPIVKCMVQFWFGTLCYKCKISVWLYIRWVIGATLMGFEQSHGFIVLLALQGSSLWSLWHILRSAHILNRLNILKPVWYDSLTSVFDAVVNVLIDSKTIGSSIIHHANLLSIRPWFNKLSGLKRLVCCG